MEKYFNQIKKILKYKLIETLYEKIKLWRLFCCFGIIYIYIYATHLWTYPSFITANNFNTNYPLVKNKLKLPSGTNSKIDKNQQNRLGRRILVRRLPKLIGNDAYSRQNSLLFNDIDEESRYMIFEKNYNNLDRKWQISSPSFAARRARRHKNLTL